MNSAIMRPRAKPTTVPAATPRASTFCALIVISHSPKTACTLPQPGQTGPVPNMVRTSTWFACGCADSASAPRQVLSLTAAAASGRSAESNCRFFCTEGLPSAPRKQQATQVSDRSLSTLVQSSRLTSTTTICTRSLWRAHVPDPDRSPARRAG
jgi:hypothetical protein